MEGHSALKGSTCGQSQRVKVVSEMHAQLAFPRPWVRFPFSPQFLSFSFWLHYFTSILFVPSAILGIILLLQTPEDFLLNGTFNAFALIQDQWQEFTAHSWFFDQLRSTNLGCTYQAAKLAFWLLVSENEHHEPDTLTTRPHGQTRENEQQQRFHIIWKWLSQKLYTIRQAWQRLNKFKQITAS